MKMQFHECHVDVNVSTAEIFLDAMSKLTVLSQLHVSLSH